MAKWSGYFWKWGIAFSLPWEISHHTKFRSSGYDLCVPYGFESCKSCSPLVWCIHQPSGWLHNFLDLVQKVLCFIVLVVSTVLLLCNLHLPLCMSKLLAGSLKQTQQNHLKLLHIAQNEVLTSFLPREDIAHLYLVRVWGLCAPQRQKSCYAVKTSEIALLSACLSCPLMLIAASDSVCCFPVLHEFFCSTVWLISDCFGFGFCLFVYGFCDGCINVGWWL